MDLLGMVEGNDRLALPVSYRPVVTPRDLPRFDRYERRFSPHIRYNGLATLFDTLDLPAEGGCNHTDRFRKSDVTNDLSLIQAIMERLRRESHPLALKYRWSVGR